MSTSKIFLNYTDWHDVDEELRTIASYGGHWDMTDWGGVACRAVEFGHITRDVVASSNIQKYRVIRMFMMSTRTR